MAQVFEGRRVFENLTVEENSFAGAHTPRQRRGGPGRHRTRLRIFVLKERRHHPPGYLSGGEQQMLVVGRALMSRPKGDPARRTLARARADDHRGDLRRDPPPQERSRRSTVLLVEQNAALALDIADHGYVMENGRIVLEGPAEFIWGQNSDIKEFYLGLNEAGARTAYCGTKNYRRRKRWLSLVVRHHEAERNRPMTQIREMIGTWRLIIDLSI